MCKAFELLFPQESLVFLFQRGPKKHSEQFYNDRNGKRCLFRALHAYTKVLDQAVSSLTSTLTSVARGRRSSTVTWTESMRLTTARQCSDG